MIDYARFAVSLGLNRCGSLPLFSAPHSLFCILKDPRGTNVEVRIVDLAKLGIGGSPRELSEELVT